MYLPATFVQQLRVRTVSGSDRIIFHLSFDIFHLLFGGREAARYSAANRVADRPVATARGSDTGVALTGFSNSSVRRIKLTLGNEPFARFVTCEGQPL